MSGSSLFIYSSWEIMHRKAPIRIVFFLLFSAFVTCFSAYLDFLSNCKYLDHF